MSPHAMPRRRHLLAVAAGLLCAGLVSVGCGGPKLFPVTGVVTVDGKPIKGAGILFAPTEGRPIHGQTDAEGKFRLTDGAPAGSYVVTITAFEIPPDQRGESGDNVGPTVTKRKWIVPEAYSSTADTPLKNVTVSASEHHFTWDIKSPPKKMAKTAKGERTKSRK
jgi:hypothetical protein